MNSTEVRAIIAYAKAQFREAEIRAVSTHRSGTTVWFDFEIGVATTSPFDWDTPFGKARVISRGCTFDERDELAARVAFLESKLAALEPEPDDGSPKR